MPLGYIACDDNKICVIEYENNNCTNDKLVHAIYDCEKARVVRIYDRFTKEDCERAVIKLPECSYLYYKDAIIENKNYFSSKNLYITCMFIFKDKNLREQYAKYTMNEIYVRYVFDTYLADVYVHILKHFITEEAALTHEAHTIILDYTGMSYTYDIYGRNLSVNEYERGICKKFEINKIEYPVPPYPLNKMFLSKAYFP